MKNKYYIPKYNIEIFNKLIYNKIDIIKILLESIKIIKYGNNNLNNHSNSNNYIFFNNNKMHRIFIILDNKYYSIFNPFTINFTNKTFKITTLSIFITSKIISDIESIINNEIFRNSLSISNYLFNQDEINIEDFDFKDSLMCLDFLLQFEPGYIRYDYDLKFSDAKLHPVNHYDINYTNSCSFKIGLYNEIDHFHFIDLLDKTTDCHFITHKT